MIRNVILTVLGVWLVVAVFVYAGSKLLERILRDQHGDRAD